eukprot:TRINITY_DN2260_c1_g2_i2.p1 TRINITY_DN2260_c1_g2~~TRINITY_DN2260_c1_g2_i2.p1  ORF type:complete len:304 (-),score=24.44 TRINITY_DN2260_c1_g2_i2:226-1116(-)
MFRFRPSKFVNLLESCIQIRLCSASADEILLRDWVRANGGFVHHDIMMVDETPNGCRGIVARNEIPDKYIKMYPLISIPQDIWATVERAMSDLKDDFNMNMDEVIDLLGKDQGQQFVLAIWLAYQRIQGEESPWYPYVNILPSQPPCAWCMQEQQLNYALQLYCKSEEEEQWRQAITDTKNVLMGQAKLLERWVKMKGGPQVSQDDILWSVGHVMSRALTGLNQTTSPGFFNMVMMPYIDLLNHEQGQGRPMGSYNVVVFARKEMKPDTELCIEYLRSPSNLQSFVKLGFVPVENM